MADIHILRPHTLGLPKARAVAFQWAEKAETDFQMACTYEEGKTQDEVTFTRSGVNGTLRVTASQFELNARLGFLLGAFKGKIESEIVKNLDTLLSATPAKKAATTKAAPAKTAAPKKK